MTMQKYGFIYIWFDIKHRRYYIGSHWGTEEDGYVCSSSWMKQSYLHRPNDFKRRIIAKTNDRKELRLLEWKYLSMIKDTEIKPINPSPRYYNLSTKVNDYWYDKEESRKTVGQKISEKKKGMKLAFKDPAERARKISETKKRKFAERIAETGSAFSPEHIAKMSAAQTGNKQSDETKQKRSEAHKQAYASGERVSWNKGKTMAFADPAARSAKIRAANLGKKLSLETIAKISATRKINRAKDNNR